MPKFPDPEQTENDVLHSLANFHNARVLEIGCGDGRMTRHFAREAAHVFGFDSDFDELLASRDDYLKGLRPRASLLQARAEAIPFASESFEPVILSWSL
jgi:ubiquinone/menaquinone biosynthesis C-methylase UbiE